MITRQHGFVELSDLMCPDHHRVKRGGATISERGALTCTHKPAAGQGECGAQMWLLNVPGNRYQHRFYVADVTFDELLQWERQGYDAEEVLRYLGAWFSRRDDRPAPRALDRNAG